MKSGQETAAAEAEAVAAMATMVAEKRTLDATAEKWLPLKSLVHHGIARPGRGRLIVSIQGITWVASLEVDGTITRAGEVYANPRSLMLAMENAIQAKDMPQVTEPSNDGWIAIRYRLPGDLSVPLGKLRLVAVNLHLMMQHDV